MVSPTRWDARPIGTDGPAIQTLPPADPCDPRRPRSRPPARRRRAAVGAAGHCSSPASTVASLISAALLAVSSVSVLVFASPRRSARAIGPLRLGQLLAVTAAELLEPFRVVAVPLAQHRGGSDLLAPLVQAGLLLSHAPRPDPVHQPVPRGGIIIN